MPQIEAYAPGTPSWFELSTTDEAGALAFYSALFGWVDDPQEMGPDWYYHMQTIGGLPVGSLYRQGEEERQQNIPPHWNTYISVDNVDAATERVQAHGGAVVFGPMDVFEAGRMSFIRDPQGAHFGIWQANQHIGARLKGEVNTACWSELMTTDQEGALHFYAAALGMERGAVMGPMNYAMLRAGGTEVAGVMQITPEMTAAAGEFPPHWSVYFMVEEVDAKAAHAEELGGRLIVPPTDIPDIGRFATLLDPQGAAFSIFQTANA